MKKSLIWSGLFLSILLYFVQGGGGYDPARLFIRGTVESAEANILVQWDSGEGFNSYEKRTFTFQPVRTGDGRKVHINIGKSRDHHGRSEGNQVLLRSVRVDNKAFDLSQQGSHYTFFEDGEGLELKTEGGSFGLDLPVKNRLSLLFKTSGIGGIATISIEDLEPLSYNLYRGNWAVPYVKANYWFVDDNGNFEVSFKLPRYHIKSMIISGAKTTHISSIAIRSSDGKMKVPFDQQESGTILINDLNSQLQRYYQTGRFIFQVVSAFFILSLIWLVYRYYQKYGGVKAIFVADKRWIFWMFLTCSIFVYGMWLIAFWPGVISVDSLNVWRAALLPEVMINDHPFINQLWYLFLYQIWHNIAIVPVSHVLLSSLLVSAAFFRVYRCGVPLWPIVVCYIFVLFSLPVGLYNTTLWKDIPFALLVVFWALFLSYLYLKKRRREEYKISKPGIFYLALLFIALVTFRHNGFIYLVAIPLLAFSLKLIKIPPVMTVIGIATAAVLLYVIVFPPSGIRGASFFRDLSVTYLGKLGNEPVTEQIAAVAKKYPEVLDIDKTNGDTDFWHYYLGDRYAYHFLYESGWYDVYEYKPQNSFPFMALHEWAFNLYKKSLEAPWRYITWSPMVLPYLFLLVILLARWFPVSAVFSTVIVVQVLALLFIVGTTNWRYYYFFYLGGYFLLPVSLVDLYSLKHRNLQTE